MQANMRSHSWFISRSLLLFLPSVSKALFKTVSSESEKLIFTLSTVGSYEVSGKLAEVELTYKFQQLSNVLSKASNGFSFSVFSSYHFPFFHPLLSFSCSHDSVFSSASFHHHMELFTT